MFYEKSVLPNGLTIISEHMEGVRSVTFGFWIRVGGRDELAFEAGISHFMEHMLFKGTDTRSALDISTEFDALGAEFNAFTSREYTCFYARMIDERLPEGFEILADMLQHSKFATEDIACEREVILEEIARSQDTPDDYVFDVFAQALFQNSTLGRPVLGYPETIEHFDTSFFKAYHDNHYTYENITLVACGNVDHEELIALAQQHLMDLPQSERLQRSLYKSSPSLSLSCKQKDCEQAHIVYGTTTISNNDPRRYAYSLLDLIIGGGMSSRLFQEIREKRGLVYSVFASSQLFDGVGAFEMYAGTRPEHIAEIIDVTQNEFYKAATEGIAPEELARAIEVATSSFVLNMESTRTHMTRLGRLSVLDLPIESLDEIIDNYKRVTIEDVNAAAAELFAKDMTLAVVSPLSQEKVKEMFQ